MVLFEERYSPVKILRDCNISSVIWGEDALRHLGVKTMVFRLHLLVPDPLAAAQTLISSGQYAKAPPVNPLDFLLNTDLTGRATRVVPTSRAPNIGTDQVVLLRATTWSNHPLPCLPSGQATGSDWVSIHFPSLPSFVNHLLTTWLESPWSDGELGQTWFDVSVWVSYIYGAGLQELTYPVEKNETGKDDAKDFEKYLGPGARELHEAMSKGEIGCLGAPDWRKYHRLQKDAQNK